VTRRYGCAWPRYNKWRSGPASQTQFGKALRLSLGEGFAELPLRSVALSAPYHVRLAISHHGKQFRVELITENLRDTKGCSFPAAVWDKPDPETYLLDVDYAVGRLAFDELEDYEQYARSVVLYESGFWVPNCRCVSGPLSRGSPARAPGLWHPEPGRAPGRAAGRRDAGLWHLSPPRPPGR
jgi:hypothetical protein